MKTAVASPHVLGPRGSVDDWPGICAALVVNNPETSTLLTSARIHYLDAGYLLVRLPDEDLLACNTPEHRQAIAEATANTLGGTWVVEMGHLL